VLVSRLIIYGDFNCPYSALASVRVDALQAAGDDYQIEWRAVQHDSAIPAAGEPIEGDTAAEVAAEVAEILELSAGDVHLELVVPPVRSNTAAACAAFAAGGDHVELLRRRLFDAVWAEGRNVGDPAELERLGKAASDDDLARRWQEDFRALPKQVTPSLVLPDGSVSPGRDALAHLAGLVAATRTR
jgi:predicted DsbA family dithiol-disulfide isomerase